ncbi:MFS general substrate transporter [Aspergillus heteromorphus CBS 117.55]|uniref:MFS general substrate transporter n=1 Tax=Aspergillus heteromorphus CBS 117.55 TaxID=1448321 RepID=A0A317WHQ1_9EURO|nr:MFS general substrate transporter [Aspergillus heteromorphus CBS 117.55]PWY84792.1 MFS general substrate transporter [Aspergillus heteromorphus CBS 117.55]
MTEAEKTVEERAAPPEATQYPSLAKVILIMTALYASMFLIFLDKLIVTAAIPRITDEFKSLGDIGWYGSSFMLAAAASQLVYGRIYTFYPAKWVVLGSILLFEIGSAVCGAAPSSAALIGGRAIAGLGTGGIASGNTVLIVLLLPLRLRPIFQSLNGVIFGVASVLGPVLGGVFTTRLTWRWCFYINLPFGGAAFAAIFFLLNTPAPRNGGMGLKEQLLLLDPLGNLALIPSVTSLLLALEWGGSAYPWNNWRILLLFILSGILFLTFIYLEIRNQEKSLIPPRIFKQRSVLAGTIWTTCMSAGMTVILYYLPLWFQVIKDVNAEKSGIMVLPFVLSMTVTVITSGILVSHLGYYNPFMYGCTIIMSIAVGLLSTLSPTAPPAKWIGYQILFGIGLGLGFTQANIAVQTCLERADVPIGACLMMFTNQLSGAVFLAVAQTLFANYLAERVSDMPGWDGRSVASIGASNFRSVFSGEALTEAIRAYSDAIMKTFFLALGMACLSVVGAGLMEWRSVRRGKEGWWWWMGGVSRRNERLMGEVEVEVEVVLIVLLVLGSLYFFFGGGVSICIH